MDTVSQVYISFEVIVGITSAVGNALVLLAIYKNRRLRTITNCFIASLAIADLIVGIVIPPLVALSYLGMPHNFYGCVFTNSIVVSFTQVSVFNLLAVALERFVAIKHPFSYQEHLTIKKAISVNVFVWIVGILFGLIPLFGWNLRYEMTDEWTCSFVNVIDMEYVVFFHFFGCIVVPLLIIVAIYSYIFVIVRKQMSQIAVLEIRDPQQQRSSGSFSRLKREIKAAKSLAIVIVLFAISWIPIHVLNSMTLMCGADCPYPFQLLLVTIVLSHANSAVNPFLYAYGNSNFKTAIKKMFCKVTDDQWATTNQPSTANNKSKNKTNGNQNSNHGSPNGKVGTVNPEAMKTEMAAGSSNLNPPEDPGNPDKIVQSTSVIFIIDKK